MRAPAFLAITAVVLGAAGCETAPVAAQPARDAKTTVIPFLMFQDRRAEEAIHRYIEVFGVGRIVFVKKYGPNAAGPEGSIEHAVFEIHGQRIGVTESPIKHPFGFTPSLSLFVDFDSEKELDRVFAALSEGGDVMMPLDNYGFSKRFAFIQDRFGVSWQLNLPSE